MARRPSSVAPRAPKAAAWVGRRQLVACIDGPLAGRWYFAEDWQTMTDAATATASSRQAAGHGRADVLRYRLTDTLVDHPTEPAVGKAARWTGGADSSPQGRRRRGPVDDTPRITRTDWL